MFSQVSISLVKSLLDSLVGDVLLRGRGRWDIFLQGRLRLRRLTLNSRGGVLLRDRGRWSVFR